MDLRADQENLVSELAACYGSAVVLRVGAFSFPGCRRSRPRPPGRPAPEEQAFEGLEMNVEVDQRALEVGDDGDGRLVLRNSGTERIGPLGCGQPLVGSLLNASHEAVGGFTGAIAGSVDDPDAGRLPGCEVDDGQSRAASTREELGYALPPGTYWLKVQMRFQHEPGGPTHAVTAPLTQITIAPERGPAAMPAPEPTDQSPSHHHGERSPARSHTEQSFRPAAGLRRPGGRRLR